MKSNTRVASTPKYHRVRITLTIDAVCRHDELPTPAQASSMGVGAWLGGFLEEAVSNATGLWPSHESGYASFNGPICRNVEDLGTTEKP